MLVVYVQKWMVIKNTTFTLLKAYSFINLDFDCEILCETGHRQTSAAEQQKFPMV